MPQDEGATPHAWLETRAVRTASDVALGIILLGTAAVALLGAGDLPPSRPGFIGPDFFPRAVGALLALAGLALLVRGALVRTAPPECWSLRVLAIVLAGLAAANIAVWVWASALHSFALLFGPAEFAALMVLILTVAIALVRISRVRAAGMVLLGLLLATVGTDVSTGTARFTMELDHLADGIMLPVVSLGLLVVGDALICLVSPSLWLATYARRIAGWTGPRIPTIAGLGMRLAAGLAIAAAGYYAFQLNGSFPDVGMLVAFGIFGIACKVFGWNRPVLILAFYYGPLLEENIRRALMVSLGDPAVFLWRPISAAFVLLALGIFAGVALLSLRRVSRLREARS